MGNTIKPEKPVIVADNNNEIETLSRIVSGSEDPLSQDKKDGYEIIPHNPDYQLVDLINEEANSNTEKTLGTLDLPLLESIAKNTASNFTRSSFVNAQELDGVSALSNIEPSSSDSESANNEMTINLENIGQNLLEVSDFNFSLFQFVILSYEVSCWALESIGVILNERLDNSENDMDFGIIGFHY
ncbi:MAG: hypothetical protein SFT91_03745 [Rickettsiaceae bacterium]|nr:hypothetical protein [Rickettsiaceae bacterium]